MALFGCATACLEAYKPQSCLTDLFERPSSAPCIFGYSFIFTSLLYTLPTIRRPHQTKQLSLWLLFFITILILCLSSSSGHTTQPDWSSWLWNFNSPGRGFWLWFLVESRFWSWTYLGFYEDYSLDDTTRIVHDEEGSPVWIFTSQPTDSQWRHPAAIFNPYWPMFKPWKDVVVRLSYIHSIDNIVHTAWLRHRTIGAPYTQYVSNSEILTLLLGVTLAIHARVRIYTHVVFRTVAEPYVYNGGEGNDKQDLSEKRTGNGDTGDMGKGHPETPCASTPRPSIS